MKKAVEGPSKRPILLSQCVILSTSKVLRQRNTKKAIRTHSYSIVSDTRSDYHRRPGERNLLKHIFK